MKQTSILVNGFGKKTETVFTQIEIEKEGNVIFLQNCLVSIQHSYSVEFFSGQSIAKIFLLIFEAAPF